MCKSCRPLSMGETDIHFRNYIKKITYGRYSPPTAYTALSELVILYVETEVKVRKIIDDYQEEGLLVSISTDIWGEDGKSCRFCCMLSDYSCLYYCYRFCYCC